MADRYLAVLRLPKWLDLPLELLDRTLEGDIEARDMRDVTIPGRVRIPRPSMN